MCNVIRKEKVERMKNKRNNSFMRAIFPMAVIAAGLVVLLLLGTVLLSKNENRTLENSTAAKAAATSTAENEVEAMAPQPKPQLVKMELTAADLESSAAYLTDSEGNVLLDINSEERLYPASLTKIMTAIIAIEKVPDLDATVTVPSDIFQYIVEEQASTAGFSPGETVTYRDLLYGTLLSSGAECCLTLASDIAGSEEQYVSMMNKKALDIGMKDTNFENVCGLHDYNHYSTAYDISVLLNYALKNKTFKEIFTSHEWLTYTDMHSSGITLPSTMFSVMASDEFRGGKLMGGKTGYTSEAGLCLASLAEIDGKEYTLVTMGADGSHATSPFHIMDAKKVYETLANGGKPMPEEPTEATEQVTDVPDETISYDGVYDYSYDDDYDYDDDYYEEPYQEPAEQETEAPEQSVTEAAPPAGTEENSAVETPPQDQPQEQPTSVAE